jgi:hypothetical protein
MREQNTTYDLLTEADSARADRFWEDYQCEHDVSTRDGQAVGIDPVTGDVWFGESLIDIVQQRREVGLDSPLVFRRVGRPAYRRKGGRR